MFYNKYFLNYCNSLFNNFYICPLDYIKSKQLPMYEILRPKESSSIFSKISSLVYMLYNEPLVAYNFICAKDNLNKKDCMLSFGREEGRLTAVEQTTASIMNIAQQIWGLFVSPFSPMF